MSVTAQNAANLLTLARLLCVPLIVNLTLEQDYHTAAIVFLLAALTDIADGYVAKRFSGTTPWVPSSTRWPTSSSWPACSSRSSSRGICRSGSCSW
jgi:hypothetical protein